MQSTLSKVMIWWWLSQVITPLPAWNDPTKHSSDNMFCFQTTIPKFFKTHHQKSSCEIHGCFWTSKPMAAVPASSRRRRLPLASNSTVPPSSWRRDGLIYLNQFVAAFGSVNKYIHTYVYMKIHIYIYTEIINYCEPWYGFFRKVFYPKSSLILVYMGLRFFPLSFGGSCPNTRSISKRFIFLQGCLARGTFIYAWTTEDFTHKCATFLHKGGQVDGSVREEIVEPSISQWYNDILKLRAYLITLTWTLLIALAYMIQKV